jgi:hypothetical protein
MSNSLDLAATATSLAEIYKGRRIAAFQHSLGWRVYLDNVMQASIFASSEEAFRWLRRKVDYAAFDSRIALLCKRHPLRQRNALRAAA